MYAGAEKDESGQLTGWKEVDPKIWLKKSIFSVKQDVKILDKNIVSLGIKYLVDICKKNSITETAIDYFLPHLSSMYFKQKVYDELLKQGLEVPYKKWFTNLGRVGNVGSASIYIMLEELFHSGKLKKGEKILILVPESGRFSYGFAYLSVV
ncbi:MAG TPA: 3-oxoacyl-[acyl-carrier-protein] synthase III C-terminal domain-containing protein [Bacteroidales bacterium]|nr:3-oxoacyl-[acyl-carrier-protein] synthase III C-terminal domain-containing protein [Bacteroidales bacterium]